MDPCYLSRPPISVLWGVRQRGQGVIATLTVVQLEIQYSSASVLI